MKSSNLKHSLAHSQNKGLSEHQRRSSQLWTGPPPTGGREAGGRQPELEGKGQSGHQRRQPHQTVSRLPVANHVFLGYWLADICQEGRSLTSAPQRRHMAHLRWYSCSAPRSGQDQGGDKTHGPPGTVCSPSTWLPELLGPGKGTNACKQLSLCLCGVLESLNLRSLDLGSARNPGPALDRSPSEQPGA